MTSQNFATLPLASIVASTTNPRKHFDQPKLVELADTADLRPRPEYELVSGERRLRASRLAGVATIPAMIQHLTDSEVLDIQIIENLHRADLDALEEAEGYAHLMDHHTPKLSVDEVAAKIGKSRSHVYSRVKLLDLCFEGREELRNGQISAAVALLIARIPSQTVQRQALGNVSNPLTGTALSYRMAADLIQRQYMLRLAEARFAPTDPELVPGAGSCKTCHKRTGADPDLFADVKNADVCTDVACFRAKEQAHDERQLKTARESGATIIEGREAKELMPTAWDGRVEGYLRLDDVRDSPKPGKTLRALLGKLLDREGIKPTMVADPHHDGALIAVIDHATAQHLLAKKGHQDAADAVQAKAQESAQAQAKAELVEQVKRYENGWRWEVMREGWHAIKTADTYTLPADALRHLATQSLPNGDGCKKLAKMLDLGPVAPRAALEDWIREHQHPERALALLIMHSDTEWRSWQEPGQQGGDLLTAMAQHASHDLNLTAIKGSVAAENMHKNACATDQKPTDLPLNPAAQAHGGGGAAAQKSTPLARARAVPKTSAEDAITGIAAAMQAIEEVPGPTAAPEGSNRDGASAVGEDGRATAPDAPASDVTALNDVDPLFEEARRVVIQNQKAGVRYLKTTLKVGYIRAHALLEQLEKAGVIGPREFGEQAVLVRADGAAVNEGGAA